MHASARLADEAARRAAGLDRPLDPTPGPGPAWETQPVRARVVEGLARWLSQDGRGLRVVARDVLGEEARIDFVALEPDGRTRAILVGDPGRDLELVALGLAQRAWLADRLPDWLQLAPDLGVRPDRGVGLLLVAPAFGAAARRVAASLGPDAVELATYRCLRDAGAQGLLVERLPGDAGSPAAPARETGSDRDSDRGLERAECAAGAERPLPAFRSGLSDEELALTPAERREFD